MALKYTLENDVDDFVKTTLSSLGLEKLKDFNEQSGMSDYMKDSLKGSAKTRNKSHFGIPDFSMEKYSVPVVIEDKLHNIRHEAISGDNIKMDDVSVSRYAVNGAVYYAKNMIASKKYDEVVAIGVSADSADDVRITVYYVFSATFPPKRMEKYNYLNFLQSKESFDAFLTDARVTEEEKHKILIKSRADILKQAKRLNKLMNNKNISTEQRVVYVSGMLLSMQDIKDKDGNLIAEGLKTDDLKGIQTKEKRDSVLIINHLKDYLDQKAIGDDKKQIMIEQFKNSISLDPGRDKADELDKTVSDILSSKCSITKQVFSFLYQYVFLEIDLTSGALDIMAEMYSTFLKYALSDGASLGKVLTPPYITTLMAKILDIEMDSRVMDIATGSAAFLVAAMDMMIQDANNKLGRNTTIANTEIDKIKKTRLLGIEVDAKMYTLAASNMLLRGDGSTKILKADTFTTPPETFSDFGADRLLLNPPFSYEDCGLPFFEFGLDQMQKNGLGAVIIQDSIGAGKAVETARRILSKHTMVASIKMPVDLFEPNATVQTSIYVFRAGTPHNFECSPVKFIDFRNDGYKRTERAIKEVDFPTERYNDVYLIYKLGTAAVNHMKFHKDIWDLRKVYIEDTITNSGDDWNADKHIKVNTVPEEGDYTASLKNYLIWNISDHLESENIQVENLRKPHHFGYIKAEKIFRMDNATPSYDKGDLVSCNGSEKTYEYITRTSENRGICEMTGFISNAGIFPSGTFSLGLMQKKFFYRQREWYAGQFVKIVTCRDDVPEDAKIYLETVLNGLTPKLAAYIVRDIPKVFYESDLYLPLTESGRVDYEWMASFVSTRLNRYKDAVKAFVDLNESE